MAESQCGENDVAYRRIGDELLIHDRSARRVCFLNTTARRVWEMTGAGRRAEEIVDALCAAFPSVDRATVLQDVMSCLAELHRLGLAAEQTSRES